MVDRSRVLPDAKPILLMVGVALAMVGVAPDGSLLLLSRNVNMDVSFLFLPKMSFLFSAFLSYLY